MENYVEYIQCGEILIAPSLNFKKQYILKCSDCDKLYFELDQLLYHSINHFGEKVEKVENKVTPVPVLPVLEDEDQDPVVKIEIDIDEEEEADTENVEFETIGIDDMDGDDLDEKECIINSEKSEKEESVDDGGATSLQTVEMQEIDADGLDEHFEEEDTLALGSDSDEDFSKCDESSTTPFVQSFMKCEKNITTLISAYKNCSLLWNINLRLKDRVKQRSQCLEQIAIELNELQNVKITSSQVSTVIRRLRYEYMEELKRLKSNSTDAETSEKKCWFFEQMNFLQPMQKNNSLAFFVTDSSQPDLDQHQIINILSIYERSADLWNTNLAEHFCHDKRLESLEKMQKTIETEMNLKTTQKNLDLYLRRLHSTFSKQKRGNKSDLYEYMTFLTDHVGRFSCSYCNTSFMNPIKYKVHVSKHDGSIPLKCSLCGKEYTTMDAYVKHARHHMNSLKDKCTECGKQCVRPADLRIHMRTHTGVKPYCCDLCGATFRYSYAFKTHMNRHENKHSHKCPYCQKGFYNNGALLSHIVTHTNTRNYECKICGKSFKRPSNLRSHKLVHEEGLNYPCTLCDKMFKNKLGVYHHMKTHSKNKADS